MEMDKRRERGSGEEEAVSKGETENENNKMVSR